MSPRHEDTGTMLDEAIYRFRHDAEMFPSDIVLMRVYLRHWIDAPALDKAIQNHTALAGLRRDVRGIHTREDIQQWMARAEEVGLDPL